MHVVEAAKIYPQFLREISSSAAENISQRSFRIISLTMNDSYLEIRAINGSLSNLSRTEKFDELHGTLSNSSKRN